MRYNSLYYLNKCHNMQSLDGIIKICRKSTNSSSTHLYKISSSQQQWFQFFAILVPLYQTHTQIILVKKFSLSSKKFISNLNQGTNNLSKRGPAIHILIPTPCNQRTQAFRPTFDGFNLGAITSLNNKTHMLYFRVTIKWLF